MVRSALLAVLALVIGSRPIRGDDAAQTPIATDRPAVADSSLVVPPGSLVVENGFASSFSHGQQSTDGSESLLRFGILSKTEVRFTAPDYFSTPAASGFGDLAVGLKQQLGPTLGGFDVSLIVSLSLPTGARAISSHGYDPFAQLPWSRSLSPNWTAAGMLSVYWPTESGRHNTTGESTFLIDRQLTKRWDAFVEYAGDFPERGTPRHLAHFGTAFKVTPNQQLDMHGGVGLSAAAVDHFIAAGYSFRWQALHR